MTVGKVTTPTLLMTGVLDSPDGRCRPGNRESTTAALKVKGRAGGSSCSSNEGVSRHRIERAVELHPHAALHDELVQSSGRAKAGGKVLDDPRRSRSAAMPLSTPPAGPFLVAFPPAAQNPPRPAKKRAGGRRCSRRSTRSCFMRSTASVARRKRKRRAARPDGREDRRAPGPARWSTSRADPTTGAAEQHSGTSAAVVLSTSVARRSNHRARPACSSSKRSPPISRGFGSSKPSARGG